MSKIKIDDLANIVVEGLQEYKNLTSINMKKTIKETAKIVKDEIKKNAPRSKKGYKHYADTWRVSTNFENDNNISLTVHAKKYQLTHLLEKGHNLRQGGRTKAYPHIKPAEEKGEEFLFNRIKEVL